MIDTHCATRDIHERSVTGNREVRRAVDGVRGNALENPHRRSPDLETVGIECNGKERTCTCIDQVPGGGVATVRASLDQDPLLTGRECKDFDACVVERRFLPTSGGKD